MFLCVATLVLVSSGHVDTGHWSVTDDVTADDGVQFVPVFQQTPRNVSVSLGDRAVLRCRVENLGTRTVRRLILHSLALYTLCFKKVHPCDFHENNAK